AIARDDGCNALGEVVEVGVRPRLEDGLVAVRVQVDEARRGDEAGAVEDVRGVFQREVADADDAVAFEGEVALEGGPAAAVNQGDVAKDVIGLDGIGAGQGQEQAQGRGG